MAPATIEATILLSMLNFSSALETAVRNISFALTTEQIRSRTKTVTRRVGWAKLQVGTQLQPIVKGQGLKKGQHAEKVGGPIRVVSVRREPLRRLLDDQAYGSAEVIREGFPNLTPQQFVTFFLASHTTCTVDEPITRIEFEYSTAEPR
jgi:hypothetical protein